MSERTAISDQGLKVAELVKSGKDQAAAIERAPGLYESRGIGNSYLVTTPAGDVLINAGALADARRGKALFEQVSTQPIRHIVLTQSHANQFGGLEVYKSDANEVIAHRLYVEEREIAQMLSEHYRRGSRRIFRRITGPTDAIMPTREVAPDRLLDGDYTLELGGRRLELLWTPGGETRSALIVWIADIGTAVVGNLFGPLFGNHPNLNTLRGDKPRSAREFIASVKRLRALRPEGILTGHEHIVGADHIERELTRIIDAVQWVHDRTVEGMNAGGDLRTLMNEIRIPPELELTEEYGKVAWNVRAIWHEYTGWFDPARGITELYGVPPSSVAPALAALAGGVEPLVALARRYLDDAQPLQALHVLDVALGAEQESLPAREARRDALQLLLKQSGGTNLWERMSTVAEIEELGL